MTNLKPFNLAAALRGEKVVTRDGREVKQLTLFDVENYLYPLLGVVNKELERWPTNGTYNTYKTALVAHEKDLFMLPKTKTYWVNVYLQFKTNLVYASRVFDDEYLAIKDKDQHGGTESDQCLKTISFEIEE